MNILFAGRGEHIMIKSRLNLFKSINPLSLCLFGFYTLFVLLNAFAGVITVLDILITFPLIWSISVWSNKSSHLIFIKDTPEKQNKKDEFWWDLFFIFYGFIISVLISFVIQYSNVDLRGWWPFVLYYLSFIGAIYALIYAFFAILLKEHKKYTFLFFFLTIIVIVGVNLIAYINPLSMYARDKVYYSMLGGCLIIHIFYCLTSRAFN
ncbi:MAG: hypothetical protein WA877_00195 [Legionella sp.]